MNYKLAQLKDKGFPMPKHFPADDEDYTCWKCSFPKEEFCIPTLSELIDACYKDDFELNKNRGEKWTACAEMKKGIGLTPEEAVAKLWLELNKK